jgi:TATA-binding protein-associated factor Taf7
MSSDDDKNSICSNDDKEEVEVKEKEEEEEEEEEDDDDDDDEGEEEEDEDEEFDPRVIQYELLKNFFVDEEGNNVATLLGSISHELRRMNKVLLKKDKN